MKCGCHIFYFKGSETPKSLLLPLWKVGPQAQERKPSTVMGNGVAQHLKQDTLVLFFEFSEVFGNMDIQYAWWDLLLRLLEGIKASLPKCNIQDNIWPALFCLELLCSYYTSLESCRNLLSATSLQIFIVVQFLPSTMNFCLFGFWQNMLEIFLVP